MLAWNGSVCILAGEEVTEMSYGNDFRKPIKALAFARVL